MEDQEEEDVPAHPAEAVVVDSSEEAALHVPQQLPQGLQHRHHAHNLLPSKLRVVA